MDLGQAFNVAIEASDDAVVVVDYFGIISMVNGRVPEMFGYQKSELIGASVELLIPERFSRAHQESRQSYTHRPPERDVKAGSFLAARKKDGTEFKVGIKLKPFKERKKTFVAAFIRKISVEKTLQLTFQKMIEEVRDYAILQTDIEGNITSWNKGVREIQGYSEKEIIGRNFDIFYTRSDREKKKHERLLERAIVDGRAQDEGWRVRKDGSTFWALVSITAIQDDLQHFVGFLQVIRDLTQRKVADERLKKQSIELIGKNKELEHFAYIASHDLQEPLSTLSSMMDLIEEEEDLTQLGEDFRIYFNFMSEAVMRMRALVTGLLEYSRLGRNRKLVAIDVGLLLDDVKKDTKSRIDSKEAKILIGEMPTIMAFDVELRLVFQNLISNALKFTSLERKPVIKVNAESFGRYWKFSINDNGIGIKDIYYKKIFTIFQRLNESKDFEGTGIGLAHCKKVIEMHHGTIWVESEFGVGSTFYFTIPNKIQEKISEDDQLLKELR